MVNNKESQMRKLNILVGHDFQNPSNIALDFCKELSFQKKLHCDVVHIAPDLRIHYSSFFNESLSETYENANATLEKNLNEALMLFVDSKYKNQFEYSTKIRFGNVHEELKKISDDKLYDFLFLGTNAKNHSDFLFGGNKAEKIIRNINIPIGVFKQKRHQTEKALVLVDMEDSPQLVVREAFRLAQKLGITKLNFATFLPIIPYYLTGPHLAASVELANIQEFSAKDRKLQEEKLHEIVKKETVSNIKTAVDIVSPQGKNLYQAVVDYLKERSQDIVIQGRHKRSAIGDFIVGSLGQTLLRKTNSNLILIPIE